MPEQDIVSRFASVVGNRESSDNHSVAYAKRFSQLVKQQMQELDTQQFGSHLTGVQGEAKFWRAESSTWDLLGRLYQQRRQARFNNNDDDEEGSTSMQDVDGNTQPRQVAVGSAGVASTDFTSVQELMAQDHLLSEYVEMRRWLEENAPPFHPVETRKGYLFYTRRDIRKRAADTASNSNVVTEVDPDATSRQRKEVALEDNEYQTGLLRTLYEYVRRGRVNSAMDLCIESDEPWRAASLRGGLLWRDPKLEPEYDMPVDKEDTSFSAAADLRPRHTAGNINRLLWKKTCAALANDELNDRYERALYAAISGRLDEVVLVCESWEDYVWAYVNATIEACIDRGIKDTGILYVPASDASLNHSQSKYAPVHDIKDVFEALGTHESETLRCEAHQPFHKLQSAIMVDKLPEYIQNFADSLQDGQMDGRDPDLLRFVVHAALYLRQTGFALPDGAVSTVLLEYIRQLSHSHRDLVSAYVSLLPQEQQIEVYAQFLQEVLSGSNTERMRYLKLAEEHRMDVDAIAERATQITIAKFASNTNSIDEDVQVAFAEPTEPVSEDELIQIRAIEWITSNPRLYEHALVELCQLARRFLLGGRTNAATQLFNALPDNFVQSEWVDKPHKEDCSEASSDASDPFVIVDDKKQQQHSSGAAGSDNVTAHFHEYIHLLSLCDAFAYYSTWAEMLYKQPAEAKAGERQAARRHAQWLEWKEDLTLATDRVANMFRDKLLEVDWLATQSLGWDLETDKSGRASELTRLRELYIPEAVFRLHSILFDTRMVVPGNLKQSLDLAQLVAGESLGIYQQLVKTSATYPRGRLVAFMDLMRRSAFEILRVQQKCQPDKPVLLAEAAPVLCSNHISSSPAHR